MSSNAHDEADTIDVDDDAGEEIPADLSAKVEGWHRDLLEAAIQTKRAGGGWSLLRKRVTFASSPPETPPDEICRRLMAIARHDIDTHGEPENIRARLKVNFAGKPKMRYARLRTVIEADGTMGFADADGAEEETSILRDAKVIVLDVLEECRKQVEVFTKMGEGLASLINSCVEMAKSHGTGDVERVRAMIEFARLEHEHAQEMEDKRNFAPIADKVADALLSKFVTGNTGTGGAGSGAKASQLRKVIEKLSPEQRQAVREILEQKGDELLEACMKADTDDIFQARAQALMVHIASQGQAKAESIMDRLAELFDEQDRVLIGTLLFGGQQG